MYPAPHHQTDAAGLALPQPEEFYRSLIESLESVLATVDTNGRLLYMNKIAASLLGGSAEELAGKTLFDLFPPAVAAQHIASVRKVMAANQGAVFESPSSIGGQAHWFHTSIQPVHDEQGAVVAALINATSIHELKQAQGALQELNRSLEAHVAARTAEVQDLYDNAPVGYHTLDAKGRFTSINQTELNWLGYTRAELIGRPAAEIVAPASQGTLAAANARLLQEGQARDLMLELVRKDGSLLSVLAHGLVVYAADGSVQSVRATLFDATERRRAGEAAQQGMQTMARALRLRDEFLANMSHELRTPLNTILTLSELLEDEVYGPLTGRQRSGIMTIAASGRHLLDLINDVLDLSKLQADQLALHLALLDVDGACRACLSMIKELAHKKRLRLTYRVTPPDLVIRADVRRLKQMVVNLLSNAVKFTPEGGVVELSVTADEGQQEVRIAVCDNGIGIAAADIPRLFQPFTQLDAGLTRQQEGTGLGLALVKSLAEQHGGRVEVDSAGIPGQGSCFTIVLPSAGSSRGIPAAPAGAAQGDRTA